jgi:hypothetical protein
MLQEAIENCPDEFWHFGEDGWIYSWIVYHVIETANFYFHSNPDDMVWGEISEIDWKNDTKEEILSKKKKNITKEEMLNYLGYMREQLAEHLSNSKDNDLLEKDDFHWFGSIFEKYVYLLRHNSLHIGELSYILRTTESKRLEWK